MDIYRTGSGSSAGFPTDPKSRLRSDAKRQERPSSAASEPSEAVNDQVVVDSLPTRSMSVQETLAPHVLSRTDTERSFIAYGLGAAKPRPLDLSIAKQRRSPQNTSYTDRPAASRRPVAPPKSEKRREGNPSGGDKVDRHVSDVLDKLPSRIRFTPVAGAQAGASSAPSASRHQQSAPTSSRPAPGGHGLTLTPAAKEGTPSKAASDSDSKLYHLSQPGREAPIKLFVRLVGEEQRVMVRVGGGWSDLGDYLRQYAEHHGSRTFSGSHVEVKEVSTNSPQVGGGKTRTTLSRPGSVTDIYSRPESVLANQRTSTGALQAQIQTPELGSSSPVSISSPTWGTPNYTYAKPSALTPKSASSKSNSRPSTAGDVSSRPGSRQDWTPGELGMAGPAGKKRGGDLTEAKARWVEDMMQKAKTASTEKKKSSDERAAFADMGRMGSARRMVFKTQD